jgi:serpin B
VAPTSIPTGTPTVPPIKYRELKQEPLEKELDEKFVKQVSEMSMKLAKASMDEDLKNNNNVLVSPINIFMALTMVLNGAGGETLDELKSFLCGDMSTEDFNKNMSLFGNNVDESANLVFNTANSVWLKKNSGWKLKEDFVNINKKYFNVECFEEEFNQETVDMLNGWVKEKTNGMIPQIIDKFDPLEVLYLVSTLVFEGEWDSQYFVNSDAKTDEFTNSKNEKEKCILLTRERNTKYIEGDKYTGFAEPYKGGKYDFVALLPNKDSSVSEVLGSLANSDFSDIYKSAGYEQVLSKMPEFKYDYSLSVKNTLKQFGVDDMFDMSRSNLSNMATSDSGVNLYAKDVCHKTHIELDRNGTKAAAVTYINIAAGAASDLPTPPPPKKVICDRPFVYVIVQRSTGIPVFVGAVNSVEDKQGD